MYWLFGDIKNLQATFKDFTHKSSTDFEDSGFVSFDFVDGGMGSLNYSTAVATKNLESSLTIIGEKGSVKIGGQYMNEVEVLFVILTVMKCLNYLKLILLMIMDFIKVLQRIIIML